MPEFQLSELDSVENLTAELRERAYGGAPAGTALMAAEQSAASGRRGHLWQAPRGGLYVAVVLRPQVAMGHLVALNTVCALAVLDALRELGVTQAQLMWPNDVVVDSKKLASTNVAAGYGEGGTFAVAHIAVNVDLAPQARAQLEHTLRNHYDGTPEPLAPAFLHDLAPEAPTGAVLARVVGTRVLDQVDAWAQAFAKSGNRLPAYAPVAQAMFDNMYLMGEPAAALRPDGTAEVAGTLRGLDIWGNAILVDDANNEVSVSPEQVTLRAR